MLIQNVIFFIFSNFDFTLIYFDSTLILLLCYFDILLLLASIWRKINMNE